MINQRDYNNYNNRYAASYQRQQQKPSTTQQLLLQIDKYSFAMDDTRLFLDTHPECEEARIYFLKMKKLRQEAIHKYEETVGSMLSYQYSDAGCSDWSWNEGPLPWDNQCCNGRRV